MPQAGPRGVGRLAHRLDIHITNALVTAVIVIAGVLIWNSVVVEDVVLQDQCVLITRRIGSQTKQYFAAGTPCGPIGQAAQIGQHIKEELRRLDSQVCSVQCLKRDRDGQWMGFITTGPPGTRLYSEHCGMSEQPGCGGGSVIAPVETDPDF